MCLHDVADDDAAEKRANDCRDAEPDAVALQLVLPEEELQRRGGPPLTLPDAGGRPRLEAPVLTPQSLKLPQKSPPTTGLPVDSRRVERVELPRAISVTDRHVRAVLCAVPSARRGGMWQGLRRYYRRLRARGED